MLPTIVLLPGMDGTGELFQPFLSALKGEFRTIVVRYPSETLTYSALTSIAASHLPTERPFVVLAESFSGPVAISLAASNPAGLLALILCASFARYPRPRLRYLIPIVGLLPKSWVLNHVINFFFLGRFSTRQVADDLHSVIRKMDKAVLLQRLRLTAIVDVVAEVDQINVPLLYMAATEDRLVPNNAMNPFARLKQCQIRKVDGPHLLLQAVPEDGVRVIKALLDSLGKTGPIA